MSCLLLCLALLAVSVPGVEEIAGDAAKLEQLPPVQVAPTDWPWWRGPSRNGIALQQNVPLTWSPTENIVWQADVPGADIHRR